MPGRGGGVGPAVQLQASCDALAGTLTAQQLPNNRQPHHHRLLVPAASSASPTYSQRRTGSTDMAPAFLFPRVDLSTRVQIETEGERRIPPAGAPNQSSAARNAWPNCAPLSSTSSQKSEPPSLSFRFHVQMITSHSSRILNREGREAMPRWCRLAEPRE